MKRSNTNFSHTKECVSVIPSNLEKSQRSCKQKNIRMKYFLAGLFIIAAYTTAIAQGQTQKVVVDKIVGAVGDRIILKSDIENAIADAARSGDKLPEGAACNILEQSLISKILALQAERDSLPVSDEEVEANLDMRVRGWVMQFGSEQAVEDVAGKTIYQLKDDSRHAIREQMLAQRMQQKIVENVHITPTEVKAFFDRVPTDSVPFLESELEIGQINIYPKAAKEVEDYIYNEMMNYRKQIESGRITFADAAKKYSEDPGSRDRGGAYEVNRNDKDQWDPVFLSTSFRLKAGELSMPVKSNKFGYFLIQSESRRGDNAKIRMILRIPPVTQTELDAAKVKLDSVRKEIAANKITFKDAAYKYSDDESVKNNGPFILGNDGSTFIPIDRLDKETVGTIGSMKVGDISQPVEFTNEQGKKGLGWFI
ncbi:peptidylprolyl isomerase [Niabella ginsengisoli]|uniref:Peptidylprolyl isomerase n=1 Tax=Niabella ginsengisoli TaxID=522298 RepID=A0ABS9SP97_9BACT|nr:peptidylprolyl isomerase [Niabella ginsengisoli]MCH5600177.1 peptidylprolyl isomerase [Niabella ginsengisoli]